MKVLVEMKHANVVAIYEGSYAYFLNWPRLHQHPQDIISYNKSHICTCCSDSIEWQEIKKAPDGTITLQDFLKRIDLQKEDAQTLAALIQNKYVFIDGEWVKTYGFRGNGMEIARFVGNQEEMAYMDYYTPMTNLRSIKILEKKFEELKVELFDMCSMPEVI